MLLRSSSTPIPSSLLPHSKESSPEHELILHLRRTVTSPRQNMAETDLQTPSKPEKINCIPRSNILNNQQSVKVRESDEMEEPRPNSCKKATPSVRELFSSSGLDKQVWDHEEGGAGKKVSKLQTLVMGGGMGCDGGRICGGYNSGGRGSDGGHGSGSEENNHGRDGTDAYYQNMIGANPNNALLLGNYAKFLKEVRGDYPKAEKYLERAILANPGDANVLSLYADLIWQTEKNADRAEGYFDQAVKSAPDDCYVLASYAKFLWDVEEDEDKDCQLKTDQSYTYPTDLFQGTTGRPHVNATSQSYLSVPE